MKKIETNHAPKVLGPYSQAIYANGFLFCSGQIAVSPVSGEMIRGGIKEETKRVLANLEAVIKASGLSIRNIIKTEVYLKNMNDFKEMNEIYSKTFTFSPQPARVTVEVSGLPRNALVEISCVAYKK